MLFQSEPFVDRLPEFVRPALDILEIPTTGLRSAVRKILADVCTRYGGEVEGLSLDALAADTRESCHWVALERVLDLQHGVNVVRDVTDTKSRIALLKSYFQVARGLLWLNAGNLNPTIYGSELAGTFRHFLRPDTPVFLTFCGGDWQKNLFVREVLDHPGSFVVRLEKRMENHFVLAVNRFCDVPQVTLSLEARHSEEQEVCLAYHPTARESLKLEVAIVLNHLLSDRVKLEVLSDRP